MAWRFYEKEKIFYFCLKSGWVKRWPGNGWGSVRDPGSPDPTVPHWNWARKGERRGLPEKGEDECWEGEVSPFQVIMLRNCSGIALLPANPLPASTC